MYKSWNNIGLILGIFVWTISALHGQDKIRVIGSTTIVADMLEALTTDDFEVEALVPAGGDPHLFEPTPSDARRVAKADLIFLNGLTLEGWINELIKNSGTQAQIFTVSEGVQAIASMDYANAKDPHAWMSVPNAKIYAKNITAGLQAYYPEQSASLDLLLEQYLSQLNALDTFIRSRIQDIPEANRILITSHDAFQYYGKTYGLRLMSVMGTSTDAEVQTQDLTNLIEVIKSTKVPAIFIESTVNPKLMEQIAYDQGVKIGGELYADALGPKGSEADTYLGMMRYITNVIAKALSDGEGIEQSKGLNTISILTYVLLGAIMIGMFIVSYIKLNPK